MQLSCPGCAKKLAIADEFAGRHVKCPSCQQVFPVPPSSTVGPAPVAPAPIPVHHYPEQRLESLSPQDALRKDVPLPSAARKSCPECGEPLAVGIYECRRCGWVEDLPSVKTLQREDEPDDGRGRCYILIRGDEVDLERAIVKSMKKFIESEELDLRIMPEHARPPVELRPNDLVISGSVENMDYGSRFMRYWLTFVSMFGPGACRLEVEVDIETAEGGPQRVSSKARQYMGAFGGDSDALMKLNVQAVAKHIATRAAREISGNSFLNAHAYICGYWSFGLGLASLLPFIGIPCGLASLIVGLLAFTTIRQRNLARGAAFAITGMVFAILGFIVNAALIMYLASQ